MHEWTAEQINAFSKRIIGCAITVHKRVGPGCLESAYAPCLALEFQREKLDFRREVALSLRYDDLVIPRAYVADFIVEECIVLEIKAVASVTELHRRQLHTYLQLSGAPLGLVMNFGAGRIANDIMRVVNNFPAGSDGTCKPRAPRRNL
jgi:GxxExxY protein